MKSIAASLLICLCSTHAFANPCDVRTLPGAIQKSLSKDFQAWKLVTPALLEASDRATWLENYRAECPGMIKGHFQNDGDAYVANLVKTQGGKTLQEVICFQVNGSDSSRTVIFGPAVIKTVTVIRKFPPGRYRSADKSKSLQVSSDAIGMSQIDSWTEVFYWDGNSFRRIVTSE